MTDCPGSCNAWWRNLTEDQQAASEHAPRPGEPVWCGSCAGRIRRCLTELDYLGALLAAVSDGHREAPEEGTRRNNGHAPSPSPHADAIDELTRMLREWETIYCETMGINPPIRHGYLADVRSEVIAFLTERLDTVLASPVAVDVALEVLQWHREFVTATKAGTGRHKKPVPCPWCGLKLLAWCEGDDYVACGNPGCRCRMTMDEYHAEAANAAARAS